MRDEYSETPVGDRDEDRTRDGTGWEDGVGEELGGTRRHRDGAARPGGWSGARERGGIETVRWWQGGEGLRRGEGSDAHGESELQGGVLTTCKSSPTTPARVGGRWKVGQNPTQGFSVSEWTSNTRRGSSYSLPCPLRSVLHRNRCRVEVGVGGPRIVSTKVGLRSPDRKDRGVFSQ